MTAPPLNSIIRQRIDIAPGHWIIYVAPDGWKLPHFEAGQYATLGLPGTAPLFDGARPGAPLDDPNELVTRDYSIVSSPLEKECLEFYLVLVDDGVFTPRLYPLKAGDRLWMAKEITGTFVLSRSPDDANLLFVATGTGIAPYISMLRTILPTETRRRIAVFHGVRHSSDLSYREELLTMDRLYPHFSYIPTISRPQKEIVSWKGRTGYVQHIWQARVLNEIWGLAPTPDNTHVYLCGSPQMIDGFAGLLGEDGFREITDEDAKGQIHVERYW